MLRPSQPEERHPLDATLTTFKPKCRDRNLIYARRSIGLVLFPAGRTEVETCCSIYMRKSVLKLPLLLYSSIPPTTSQQTPLN